MVKKIRDKLNSSRGETISETLVALLISSMALVMLAGAITSASNVVERSRKKLDEYYSANENNGVTNMSKAEKSGTAKLTDKSGGETLPSQTYSITYYENTEFSRTHVISYTCKETTAAGSGN